MKLDYSPRIFYGKRLPDLKDCKRLGVQFFWRENIFVLLSTLEPDLIKVKNGSAGTEFEVSQGERVIFSLSYSNQSPAVLPELKQTAWKRMQDTLDYWRGWIQKCQYSGVYHQQVKRSALALKLLAH